MQDLKLVMDRCLLGCKERSPPVTLSGTSYLYDAIFFFPAIQRETLRYSVLYSSSPEPCHVLSIGLFFSFLKKMDQEALHRVEVREGS